MLGDLVAAGLGAQGDELADLARRDRARGGRDGLAAADGRAAGDVHRRRPGHRLHRDACALLCARERTTRFAPGGAGLQAAAAPLVVYASDQAHSSVEKAALLAGFGKAHLRLIATDERARAAGRPRSSEAIAARPRRAACARARSWRRSARPPPPPLDPVAEHRRRRRAARAVAPRRRRAGRHGDGAARVPLAVGTASSAPTRWCSTRTSGWASGSTSAPSTARPAAPHPRDEHEPDATCAPRTTARSTNFRDWGIPLGRRFRALKGWFHLVDEGVAGHRRRAAPRPRERAVARRRGGRAPGWERLAPVPLQTVCLRHVPGGFRRARRGAALGRTTSRSRGASTRAAARTSRRAC